MSNNFSDHIFSLGDVFDAVVAEFPNAHWVGIRPVYQDEELIDIAFRVDSTADLPCSGYIHTAQYIISSRVSAGDIVHNEYVFVREDVSDLIEMINMTRLMLA